MKDNELWKKIIGGGSGLLLLSLIVLYSSPEMLILSDGDISCTDLCISHIYIIPLTKEVNLGKENPVILSFSDKNVRWKLFKVEENILIQHSQIDKLFLKPFAIQEFVLVGYKPPYKTVKWSLSVGKVVLDPYWYYDGNIAGENFTVYIAEDYNEVNITCFQPYMENTEPNGQDYNTGIFQVTNTGNATLYNITISLNQSLTTGFTIYAQTANYVHSGSITLNTTNQTIIKRLIENQSKDVWLYGKCENVSDDQTISLNYSFGGG